MSMLFFSLQVKSQKEIARLDYTMLPDVNDSSISDLNFAIQHTLLTSSNSLTLYFDYLKRDFDFFNAQGLSQEEVQRFHQLEVGTDFSLGLGNSYNLNLLFNPTISSTWGTSLSSEDFLWNYSASLSKVWFNEKEEMRMLKVGFLRNALFGEPRIIPAMTYKSEWDNRWFLELGFPSSSVAFEVNERNRLTLSNEFVGTYTNISTFLDVEGLGQLSNAKLVQNGIQLAGEYSYRIQPNFTTVIRIGYQFINEFEVENNSGTQVHDFGTDTSIFFSIGIQYNLK